MDTEVKLMTTTTDRRYRAWVLLQVNDPHQTAHALYEELKDQGDEKYVVVRADAVAGDGLDYNIVIPVDAHDGSAFEQIYATILEISGADASAKLPVLEHVPSPPQNAQGYITQDEYERGDPRDKDKYQPGRQGNSPGWNAWG